MILGILIHLYTINTEEATKLNKATSTTIRVSKKTAKTLEDMRKKLNAQTLDETIQMIVKKQRKAALDKGFGIAQNRIKPFTETNRGENRN